MFWRKRNADDFSAEIKAHIALEAEQLEGEGHTPEEAMRRARVAFGSTRVAEERFHTSTHWQWMEDLAHDLRFGFRVLRGNPLFAAVAIASLALGIGANTAIFAVAKTVLFDTLPVHDPHGLRLLTWASGLDKKAPMVWGDATPTPDGRISSTSFSYPVFAELRQNTAAFEDLFAFKDVEVTVAADGDATLTNAELISGNTFSALGIAPLLGRTLTPADDTGTSSVAVISASYWASRFGRLPSAVGQVIAVNGVPVTIVGVAAEHFEGLQNSSATRIFLPVTMQPVLLPRAQRDTVSLLNSPQSWWLLLMARVRPGVSEEGALQQLDATLQHAMAGVTLDGGATPQLHLGWQAGDRGLDYLKGALATPSYILLALASLVLLLACVNLANLLLARATAREREVATRLALGAGRMRIMRQMITESLLLAALGGAAGLALGYIARNAIPHLLATRGLDQMHIDFDARIIVFTVAVTLLTGLLFGAFPAWQATHTTVSTNHTTTRRRKLSAGKTLVVLQIALSTVLLIGAGLFTRTLTNLLHTQLGFASDHLLLFHLKPPRARYTGPQTAALYEQISQRLAALPGVKSVATSTIALIGDGHSGSTFQIIGQPSDQPTARTAARAQRRIQMNLVSHDYFRAMSIPILRGRPFDTGETSTSSRVAVINQTLARTYFPNQDPLGQMFLSEDSDTPVRIIGVAADTSYATLREKTPPLFFLSVEQSPADTGSMAMMVRTALDPLTLAPAIRQIVTTIDPNLPLVDLRTMDSQIDESLTSERTFAQLTAGFGILALVLVMVGIYGIMAYTVSRRTNEIGVRMALGAQSRTILTMVLGEATTLALTGIVLGAIAATLLTRYIAAMLYGLSPFDPLTIFLTANVLGAITLVAAFGPAYRASHVNPLRALRHE